MSVHWHLQVAWYISINQWTIRCMLSWLYRTHCYHTINDLWAKKKKNTLVSGNAGDKKNLHTGARRFFLSIFQRYYLFFSFFCLFVFLFFFLFSFLFLLVWFLKLKINILIHIRLCGGCVIKKISPGRFPEIGLLFLALWNLEKGRRYWVWWFHNIIAKANFFRLM